MTLLRYVIRIWLLKIIILFSIMLITMIGMPLGFGESPILIQTDKKEYSIGDDIILQGTVKFVNGKALGIGLPKNLDVAIEVYNSKNQLITSHIADVKNDDSFFLKIKTGKNSSILIDDRYFFVAYYGIATPQLLNSDFVGKYDVYVGVSALNPNISSKPIQDNTKPNISPPNNSPPLTLDDPTVGLFVFVACMAIIFGLYFGTPFFKSKKTSSSQIYRNPSNRNRRNYSNPTRSNYKKRGTSAKWSKRASKVWAKSFKEFMAEESSYSTVKYTKSPIPRPTIPPNVRHQVFERDNYKCRQCGISKNDSPLEIDHIKPFSKGGPDTLENYQLLCKRCNRSKHTSEWKAPSNKK